MNLNIGRNDDEIGLMSLLDDLIVLHNGERYTIDGYINKLQQENKQLKEVIGKIEKFIIENKEKVYHNPFIDDDCGIEIYLGRLEIEELEKIIIKAKGEMKLWD